MPLASIPLHPLDLMKIDIAKFQHGPFAISLGCEVEGEASGHMHKLAVESIKTAVASALDSAAGKVLAKDVEYKRKALTRPALEAAFKAAKAPEHVTAITLAIVGDWESSSDAKAANLMATLRAANTAEAVIEATCKAAGLPYKVVVVAPVVEEKAPEGEPAKEGELATAEITEG